MRDYNNSRSLGFAILVILVGFVLLLYKMNVIPYFISNVIISWQMLLIVIGVFNLFCSRHRVTGIILIAVGGFFLVPEMFMVPISFRRVFWPVILIFVGLAILIPYIRGRRRQFDEIGKPIDKSTYYLDDVSVFGGSDKTITSQNFRGGKITSIFGGSKINLTEARLSEGSNIIDVFYLFGGTNLIIPPEWNVKMEVISVFGGFSDKRRPSKNIEILQKNELVIKGLCIFGGGEIKDY